MPFCLVLLMLPFLCTFSNNFDSTLEITRAIAWDYILTRESRTLGGRSTWNNAGSQLVYWLAINGGNFRKLNVSCMEMFNLLLRTLGKCELRITVRTYYLNFLAEEYPRFEALRLVGKTLFCEISYDWRSVNVRNLIIVNVPEYSFEVKLQRASLRTGT